MNKRAQSPSSPARLCCVGKGRPPAAGSAHAAAREGASSALARGQARCHVPAVCFSNLEWAIHVSPLGTCGPQLPIFGGQMTGCGFAAWLAGPGCGRNVWSPPGAAWRLGLLGSGWPPAGWHRRALRGGSSQIAWFFVLDETKAAIPSLKKTNPENSHFLLFQMNFPPLSSIPSSFHT